MRIDWKRILSGLCILCICFGMLPAFSAEVSAADNIVIAGVDIGYADGSFFTKNGKTCKDNNNYNINGVAKASCHGRAGYSCANSTDPSCNCMRYWPTGVKETCQIDLRGTQCYGFARYCQWKVYGTYDGNSPAAFTDLTGVITESQCTGENLKQKLLGCAPATHLRSRSSKRGEHSVSIISTSDSGVIYVDCNTDGGCVVRRFSVSWEELAKFMQSYGGVAYAYSYSGNQPAPDCGCDETDSGTYICMTTKDPLSIRSGHGVNYARVGSIPPGAAVTVTKASGTGKDDWAHVTYNGVSGYASMEYLQPEASVDVTDEPITVHLSEETLSLVMGEREKEASTLQAWATGSYSGEWVLNWQSDSEIIGCSWGEWDNGKVPLTVTAKARGEARLTVSVKSKEGGAILDSKTVTVRVDALEYTVSYDANGGTGGPDSQTKYHGTLLRLSAETPKRAGYSFLGWSPYRDADEPAYMPGEEYDLDESVELYAVWLPGCEADAHIWEDATCEAAKTCSLCGKAEGEPGDHIYEKGVCIFCGVEEYLGLRGDANGDERLNYNDALLVLRFSVGLENMREEAQALCDVDGKPGLSYQDALKILRASIGLETL
jgi:hypothetical protein